MQRTLVAKTEARPEQDQEQRWDNKLTLHSDVRRDSSAQPTGRENQTNERGSWNQAQYGNHGLAEPKRAEEIEWITDFLDPLDHWGRLQDVHNARQEEKRCRKCAQHPADDDCSFHILSFQLQRSVESLIGSYVSGKMDGSNVAAPLGRAVIVTSAYRWRELSPEEV